MLDDAKRLAFEGLAVHWLHERSKRPRGNDWSERPVATPTELEETYRKGFNVGIRLGEPSQVGDLYCHVLDVDVRDPELEQEAFDALHEMLEDSDDFPAVKSGSGGPSEHIYFFTRTPYRSKKLRHSATKITSKDKDGKEHKHWAWEIELFGTGKQVAAPPSIHPDTGMAYHWLKEIDFDSIHNFIVEDEVVEGWGGAKGEESDSRSSTRDDDSSSSLSALASNRPLGLSAKEVVEYLSYLDHDTFCFDYEGWLKVGMALHHEFEGDSEGLDIWHDYSETADNYDAAALDLKWDSFGKTKSRRNVRFATIIAAGAAEKAKRDLAGADSKEDMDSESDEDNETSWLSELDFNDKGMVKAHLDNLTLIFEHDPRLRGLIAQNLFTGYTVFRKPPGRKIAKTEKRQKHYRQLEGPLWVLRDDMERANGRQLLDVHASAVRTCLEGKVKRGGYGIKVSDRDATSARDNVANKQQFHPIREFLESLTWDGVERLDYMFIDWLGCPDTDYYRQTASHFAIAAVMRAYEPGSKFDYSPIIEGKQGIRKSTFIKTLALDWFSELDCGFDDAKRIVETLQGRWVLELPELSQFARSEVETIKAFFSKTEDNVRLSYRREPEAVKRQSVYMGTTNNREYLRDPTGGRRFWPITCTLDQIDTDGFAASVEQIWAEALVRYRDMRKAKSHGSLPLMLSGQAANDEALGLQESRRVETTADAWAGKIEAWADTPIRKSDLDGVAERFDREDGQPDILVRREVMCGLEVWSECLGGNDESYGRQSSLRVVDAIRLIPGWVDAGREYHRHYGRQRVWKRVAPSKMSRDLLG